MNNCKQIPNIYLLLNDVSLHILILFVILSAVFIFYISKVESENINNEIIKYTDKIDIDSFFNSFLKSDVNKLKESNFFKNINSTCNTPGDSFPCDSSGNDPLGTVLRSIFIFGKSKIEDEITKINTPDDKTIKKYISKILKPEYFDYVINKLKSTKNQRSEEINLKLKEEICIVIGFLIVLTIIINIIPIQFFKYCNDTFLGLIGKLIIVFILIGIIEILFFENVASKYNPVEPSLIVQSFKDKCLKIINNE